MQKPFANISRWIWNPSKFEDKMEFTICMNEIVKTYTLASEPMGEKSVHGKVYTLELTRITDPS